VAGSIPDTRVIDRTESDWLPTAIRLDTRFTYCTTRDSFLMGRSPLSEAVVAWDYIWCRVVARRKLG